MTPIETIYQPDVWDGPIIRAIITHLERLSCLSAACWAVCWPPTPVAPVALTKHL